MKFKDVLKKIKRGNKPVPSIITIFRHKKRLTQISVRDLDLLDGKRVPDLLQKFPLTPSKTKVLDKLVTDYRKGNLSLSGSTTSKYKKKKLNKEKLEKIIEDYEDAKKRRRTSLSLRIIDKLKDLDIAELRDKFSWTSSKEKLYAKMMEDYYDDKISLSKLSNKSRFDPSTMSKGKMDKLLQEYEVNRDPSGSLLETVRPYSSLRNAYKFSIKSLKSLFRNDS